MSISSINYSSSVLGSQIRNINQQLTDLSTQLSTGKLSQNYSGMGTNEGFAIAGRAQLSNIAAYTDTMTNVNVNINLANTALQSLTTIRNTVQTGSANTAQDLNVNGQTVAQNTAAAQFGSMVGVLNTQSGNRYLFSGTAVQHAVGCQCRRHHQRHHDAGGLQDRHGGTPGRRPRRQRHGPAGADDASRRRARCRCLRTPPDRRSA